MIACVTTDQSYSVATCCEALEQATKAQLVLHACHFVSAA